MKRYLSLFAVFVGLVAHPSQVRSQTNPASLAGIKAAVVLIENNDPAVATSAGITDEGLRTQVELKLRLLGIRVIAMNDLTPRDKEMPFVYVELQMLKVADVSQFVYGLDLSVRRFIVVNGTPVPALMWTRGTIGIAGSARMPNAVVDRLSGYLDSLMNDWLIANPRQ